MKRVQEASAQLSFSTVCSPGSPAEGMDPLTADGSSHLSEQSQDNPPQACSEALLPLSFR